MRYFLHLAYNGFNYRGWQRQITASSVQEQLENALGKILKQKISCYGCGRTDAMVHACQFFVHFDYNQLIDFDIIHRLEKTLPHDIVVFEIFEMKVGNEHARFDAIERSYTYFTHTEKDPYLHSLSSYYEYKTLDFLNIKKTTDLLLKYIDFGAFCLTPDRHNTTICHITDVHVYTNSNGNRLRFEISANRFLKGMIRIIIGKLMEVGSGKISVAEFEELLITKKRSTLMNSAYPQGLYLSKIRYPYLDIPTKTEFWNMFNQIEWIEM